MKTSTSKWIAIGVYWAGLISNAHAGFGGMGNIEPSDVGSTSWVSLLFALLFFGGIALYFIKSKDENSAFMKLMMGVFALIVVGAVTKCAG